MKTLEKINTIITIMQEAMSKDAEDADWFDLKSSDRDFIRTRSVLKTLVEEMIEDMVHGGIYCIKNEEHNDYVSAIVSDFEDNFKLTDSLIIEEFMKNTSPVFWVWVDNTNLNNGGCLHIILDKYYLWETSSGHLMVLIRDIVSTEPYSPSDIKYTLYTGQDISKNFYPILIQSFMEI